MRAEDANSFTEQQQKTGFRGLLPTNAPRRSREMIHFLEAALSKSYPPSGLEIVQYVIERVDDIIRAEGAGVDSGWRVHPGSLFVSAEANALATAYRVPQGFIVGISERTATAKRIQSFASE